MNKFGVAGDGQICIEQEKVTDGKHYYGLKYKYACLVSGNGGDFDSFKVDDEVFYCLSLFYDYSVE